jgi:hypothetical protein
LQDAQGGQREAREGRLDAELMHGLADYDDVVAQHLRQYLVRHTRRGLRQHGVTELALDHAERCLHVRSLVIAAQELLQLVGEHG